ncbi:MAG: hypothetical protein ABEJ65_00400 [bacterium]
MRLKNTVTILGIILCLVSPGIQGTLFAQSQVEPGEPSSFDVDIPSSARAGERFSLQITVKDPEGNVVTDYDEFERVVELSVIGEGELSQSEFSSGEFKDGVSYKLAEEITLEASERDHVATGRSDPIIITAAKPSRFEIDLPARVKAGVPFSLTLTVVDDYGNRVRDYDESTNGVTITADGVEQPSPQFLSAEQFNNGRLETKVSYNVAEEIELTVTDEVNSFRSTSPKIDVLPGSLHKFNVSVPNDARAGEKFQVAIEAKDRYGNVVTDYDQKGHGVEIRTTGDGKIKPDFLPAESFKDGVVFEQFSYTKTGPLRVVVRDKSRSAEGRSDRINVRAGHVQSFKLGVPGEVTVGVDFNVSVTALDKFGNIVKSYNKNGSGVNLVIQGDTLVRKTVSPKKFSKGKASVTLSYTSSELVRVEATHSKEANVSGLSNRISVVAGKPGDIKITTPESVKAGNQFSVVVQLQDQYGNNIHQTTNYPGFIRTSLINHEQTREKKQKVSNFLRGQSKFSFQHTQAETVSVFAEYVEFDIRTSSRKINVQPASFHHVALRTPGSVRAGKSFDVGVQLRDKYGNPIQDLTKKYTPFRLETTGNDNVSPKKITGNMIQAPSFTVPLKYYVAESMSVKLLDQQGNQRGRSPPIQVSPGPLASVEINVPSSVSADESFPVQLKALDPYQNLKTDLGKTKGEITLSTNGSDKFKPQSVKFKQFSNGVAEFEGSYHTAETLKLFATTSKIETSSTPFTVRPGPPKKFRVSIQKKVIAGKPFPATIEIFDQYDNPIKSLPSDFHGVKLAAEGFDRVSPPKITSKFFSNGEAKVNLIFPKTGDLSISAKQLKEPLKHPIVERFYYQRNKNNLTVNVVSSHPPPVSVKQSDQGPITVKFQPAQYISDPRTATFDDWFVKGIHQAQNQGSSIPTVDLSIYTVDSPSVTKGFSNNLFTLKLSRSNKSKETQKAPKTPKTPKTPTLQEIRNYIENEEYQKADDALADFLKEHPNHKRAKQLKLRLDRIQDLTGQ